MGVRLESSRRITELFEHEADAGKAQENNGAYVEVFPILGQPAATVSESMAQVLTIHGGIGRRANCIGSV
jgi:hypothetical protein